MLPTIGRSVHFFEEDDGMPRAAVVTVVHSETCVDLCVFPLVSDPPGRSACVSSVEMIVHAQHMKRRWGWPPRPFQKADGEGDED